jgi:hypothetical protein
MSAVALLSWHPTSLVHGGLKYGSGSGIPEMSETECERIDASGVGEFIHEGFDRKDVSVRSQGSERSVADRRIEQKMISDLLPR